MPRNCQRWSPQWVWSRNQLPACLHVGSACCDPWAPSGGARYPLLWEVWSRSFMLVTFSSPQHKLVGCSFTKGWVKAPTMLTLVWDSICAVASAVPPGSAASAGHEAGSVSHWWVPLSRACAGTVSRSNCPSRRAGAPSRAGSGRMLNRAPAWLCLAPARSASVPAGSKLPLEVCCVINEKRPNHHWTLNRRQGAFNNSIRH